MDEKQLLVERWKSKIVGIRPDPPIDYKLMFGETVKNLASQRYTLLDIGTGVGRVIFENNLDKIYRKVVGIDIVPEMISVCKENAKGMKNVEFHVMDSKNTTFKPGTFDVVTAMFPPYDPKEVNRLLSPGGYFVLLTSIKGDHKEIAKHFPEVESHGSGNPYATLGELKGTLKRSGFKIVSYNVLHYKWIFKDEETLKLFYEKITFTQLFDGKEGVIRDLKKNIDGGIPITRLICTVVAKRV